MNHLRIKARQILYHYVIILFLMSTPINFFKGHPSISVIPTKEIANAYNKVLLGSDYLEYQDDPQNRHPLIYGTDPGNFDIRSTISRWNNRLFETNLSKPENINLTAGASFGIANILTSVTDTSSFTKRAFVVSPTYFLINDAFIDAGFENKLTAINELKNSEYDIDIEYLEERLKFYSQGLESSDNKEINIVNDPNRGFRKYYRFVMYLVPTYSNPGGLTYSTATRKKLILLSRKYDMLLISDDVYELLNYDNSKVISRLNYLDQQSLPEFKTYGNTVSNASFSKLLAPGLRVGWQESASSKLVHQLASTGATQSGGTPNHLSTFVVREIIESGEIDQIVTRLCKTYRERVNILKSSISQYLPKETTIQGGNGGYFLWIIFNYDFDHMPIAKILKDQYNVIIATGDNFEVTGDLKGWGRNCVRLSISCLTGDEIKLGIKKWGEVLRKEHPELY